MIRQYPSSTDGGPTAPRRASGLGLGLFIAREIVAAHGGELAVRVAEGRTVFEATFPRAGRREGPQDG